MSLSQAFLSELEQESQATQRLFERLPEDKLGWRPHPKSFSLGELAMHIAQLPGGIVQLAKLGGMEVPDFSQVEAKSISELTDTLRTGLDFARVELPAMSDEHLAQSWSVTLNGAPIMTMPRAALLRNIMLNHSYHHRGQLTVYLRLLDIPLPVVYGKSADENPFAEPAH